jgi:hypothetical protein
MFLCFNPLCTKQLDVPGDGLEKVRHALDRPKDSTEEQYRVEAADGGLHGIVFGRADDGQQKPLKDCTDFAFLQQPKN